MRYLLFIPILVLACGTPSSDTAGTSSIISDADEAAVREFKTVLWGKAYGEQDTVLLAQLLHEGFQLIDDNGDTYSKEDELAYVGQYGPSYDEFEFSISRLELFDNGTAVVFGTGTMKGVNGDEAYITTYKSSNVLIKVGDQWQAINSHVSGVKEETFPMASEEE